MNPIHLAGTMLLLLALVSKAKAGTSPGETKMPSVEMRIASQFKLNPNEAARVKNKTVRFYFCVNASGEIKEVVAAERDPQLRQMLEDHFRQLTLSGFPVNAAGKVDVNFRLL